MAQNNYSIFRKLAINKLSLTTNLSEHR